MDNLTPDRTFSRISDIKAHADLLDCGLDCALLDIDSTIRSRVDGLVPPDVLNWIEQVQQEGVRLCLLSNNGHQNVPDLAAELGLPYIYKAMKPLKSGYRRALALLGTNAGHAVMIGDQLGTDIAGAHRMGMTAYLVAPLGEADLWYAKYLRKLERLFLQRKAKPTAEREPAPAFAQTDGSRKE